jgi:hypothetical protein
MVSNCGVQVNKVCEEIKNIWMLLQI